MGTAMAGMLAARLRILTPPAWEAVFAAAAAWFTAPLVVSVGDRLTAPAGNRPSMAPRCAALCKIAMGLTMGYMLVLMM